MIIDKLIESIARQAGLDADQDKLAIMNALEYGLPKFDRMHKWTFAIVEFEAEVNSGDSYFETTGYDVFKVISIKLTEGGGNEFILYKGELTDFRADEVALGTATNSDPGLFALGNRRIYVGPKISTTMTASGDFQRKLSMADLPSLPSDVVVDFAVKTLTKKGEPESIAAWSEYNTAKSEIQEKEKDTAISHTSKPPDAQSVANQGYYKGLEQY